MIDLLKKLIIQTACVNFWISVTLITHRGDICTKMLSVLCGGILDIENVPFLMVTFADFGVRNSRCFDKPPGYIASKSR